MASKKDNKSRLSVVYEFSEGENNLLNKAFDILFEEVLKQNNNLTTNDN